MSYGILIRDDKGIVTLGNSYPVPSLIDYFSRVYPSDQKFVFSYDYGIQGLTAVGVITFEEPIVQGYAVYGPWWAPPEIQWNGGRISVSNNPNIKIDHLYGRQRLILWVLKDKV